MMLIHIQDWAAAGLRPSNSVYFGDFLNPRAIGKGENTGQMLSLELLFKFFLSKKVIELFPDHEIIDDIHC